MHDTALYLGGLYFFVNKDSANAASPGYAAVTRSGFRNNIATATGGAFFTNVPEALEIFCDSDIGVSELEGGPGTRERPGVTAVIRTPSSGNISSLERDCGHAFSGNVARSNGGGNLAATTATTITLCKTLPGSCVTGHRALQVKNHTSGEDIELFSMHLKDALGNPALGQPKMLVTISNNDIDAVLRGDLIQSSRADMDFTDIRLQAAVNKTHTLNLTFDPPILPAMSIDVQVRDCLPGEFQRENGEMCEKCADDFYSFEPSPTCVRCPSEAKCQPSTVTPLDGFWHSTSKSPQIQECTFRAGCAYEGREDRLQEQARRAHAERSVLEYRNNTSYQQCAEVRCLYVRAFNSLAVLEVLTGLFWVGLYIG